MNSVNNEIPSSNELRGSNAMHDYTFLKIPSSVLGVNKFVLRRESSNVSFDEAMSLLASGDLSDFITQNIVSEASSKGWRAVFWECIPTTADIFHRTPFEFVLLEAPGLTTVTADPNTFKEQFESEENTEKVVVVFSNLGKDSHLVVPKPNGKKFPHILAFLHEGSREQQRELWRMVGLEYRKQVVSAGGAKKWLSTSGMGVYWLHVRIDCRPKYYNYKEYKNM